MKKFFSLNFSSSFSKNISRREILGLTSVIMFLGIPKILVASNVQLEKKNFAHNYARYKGIPIIFLKELSVLLKNGGSLLINGKKDDCGTYYLGNGGWGAAKREATLDLSKPENSIYASATGKNNCQVLIVKGSGEISALAIDTAGKEFDSVNWIRSNCG